ncbi:MAG TPA: IS21 family transposase [Negativicutes bacterium]|nr:IS21 family transposase [Negativicutes bacterium]
MSKVREILRLKFDVGLSLRDIAASCNCGKSTVDDVLKRAKNAEISWPCYLNDKELLSLIYPPAETHNKSIEPDVNYIFNEMKKKNVTLMLLWEEYKRDNPDGLMYTQFCERYRDFKKTNQISMHIEHKAGEEMQVDWAGSTISYIEPSSGQEKQAYLFVSVLPASSYPFAYAYGDMKLPNWIDAHVRAFEYYGGVPRITIPDNTKTAVKMPDLVDPQLNKSYSEMAAHYGTTLVPARPGKPRDKAADENMVGNISRRIIAALRNYQFFSLSEINKAVKAELSKFVSKPFQKIEGNRLSAFETIDKPALKALPAARYEYADWKEAKIAFNYHVEYEGFFYSVHYSHIGRIAAIRATASTIEIFVDNVRAAAHPRNFNTYKRYTTLPEHMPESHKAVTGWNSEKYLAWAEKIGPQTKQLIANILDSREYPVQTYRACMGIMRLSSGYPPKTVEAASKEAIEKRTCNYKYFSIIIKQMALKESPSVKEKIVANNNIRGAKTYAGGGLNA